MLSVITSVYNSEEFLPAFLSAVNNQLLPSFEILFYDANSTDKSLEIIKNFKFREGIQYRIIEGSERIPLYNAWNIMIKEAKGNYIVNWNTDDLIYPSGLLMYEFYTRKIPDVDLFYGGHLHIKASSYYDVTNVRIWPEPDLKILKQICICGPFPCVKKESLINVGLFDESLKYSSDYDMWLKLMFNGKKFERIPEFIGCFFDRPESISIANIEQAQKEDRAIHERYK